MSSRTLRPLAIVALAGFSVAALSTRASAQERLAPTTPRSIVAVADSIAGSGDSTRALAVLDSVVRAEPRNAAAWHRRGMLLWGMSRSRRSASFIKDPKVIRMITDADSSLRLARQFAPDSAQFATDLGRFFLNSNLATLRWQAPGVFEEGVRAAEAHGTPWEIAEASDELGMAHWRRYETVARRRMTFGSVRFTGDAVDAMAANANYPSEARNFVESMTAEVKSENWMGRSEYEQALELFTRALTAAPDHPKARRHYYMALADRERWDELADVTTSRVRKAPWDATALFAQGLALYRGGHAAPAQAAFDSALAYVGSEERARLTNLARLLRTAPRKRGEPSDSAGYATATPEGRVVFDSLYWQLADPLSLTPENERRLEFVARVVFAELMWTSDDLDRHGADSDRGEIWIRYGPPRYRFGLPPSGTTDNREMWLYPDGTAYTFLVPPTWGTARYSQTSRTIAEEAKAATGVSWRNVPIETRIDSVMVQAARFRGTKDSSDVIIVGELPLDSLLHGVELKKVPLDVAAGIWTGLSTVLLRDSTRLTVDAGDLVNAPRVRAWRERLPAGEHVYRVEALQPDAMRGARALGRLRVLADTGFATSDLLVAARVSARESAPPRRWRDLILAPSAGRFARGEPIGLLWETYGLKGNAEGSVRYRVAVTLTRRFESKAGAFVARVVSGVGGSTGLAAQERGGKAGLRYERTAPAGDVALDWLSLDVGAAPAGQYRVTIEVTDLVANRVTTTSRLVRIE